MESLPSSSPHFIGAVVAVVGLLAVLWASKNDAIRARLGTRRPLVLGLGSVVLVGIGLLGNGPYGLTATGTLWSDATPQAGLVGNQSHAINALAVALSDDFIAYDAQLHGTTASFSSADFEPHLDTAWLQNNDGTNPGGSELKFRYVDIQNVFYEWIGKERDPDEARWSFLLRVQNLYLYELVALDYFTHAVTPEQRIEALKMMRDAVPSSAEWSIRALAAVDDSSFAAEVQSELLETRTYLEGYVQDPTLRSLPADRKVELPALAQ
jgi:hypothetical protein